jgi:class 3 adenylate cyclase
MGLHTGEPMVTEEGYVGIDVHRAARIAAAGHGGQILVSQATRDLAGPDRLHDLGVHRLQGPCRTLIPRSHVRSLPGLFACSG